MLAAADEDAFDGTDVAIVAAPGEGDVAHSGDHVVGRIEVDPTSFGTEGRDPRVRRIGADHFRLARRRLREEITAHISRGETHRTEATDLQVGEVLAHTAFDP